MTSTFAKSASATVSTTVSTLVLALAALGSVSSFAGANGVKNSDGELRFPVFASTLTRDQVRAEYFQAVKAGQIVQTTEGTTLKAPAFVSTRSSAEVKLCQGDVAVYIVTITATPPVTGDCPHLGTRCCQRTSIAPIAKRR